MNVCISSAIRIEVVKAAMDSGAGTDPLHDDVLPSRPGPFRRGTYGDNAEGPKGDIEWVVHFTTGSEAIDLAMAMARGYTGNPDLIALRTAYHGPTSAAQSVTGIAAGAIRGCPATSPSWPSRTSIAASSGAMRGRAYLDEIERVIQTSTTGRVAGILIESVQGYGGIIEMPPAICPARRNRCGRRAACISPTKCNPASAAPAGIVGLRGRRGDPDIVVMAKGISTASRWARWWRGARSPSRWARGSCSTPTVEPHFLRRGAGGVAGAEARPTAGECATGWRRSAETVAGPLPEISRHRRRAGAG